MKDSPGKLGRGDRLFKGLCVVPEDRAKAKVREMHSGKNGFVTWLRLRATSTYKPE